MKTGSGRLLSGENVFLPSQHAPVSRRATSPR